MKNTKNGYWYGFMAGIAIMLCLNACTSTLSADYDEIQECRIVSDQYYPVYVKIVE